ncbi:MAG: SMP-30/gluconolactonase/LRE family protein [candidate division KSB1 bacterium]
MNKLFFVRFIVSATFMITTQTSFVAAQTLGTIHRIDAQLDQLVPRPAVIEKLAEGFEWSEGPIWVARGNYLLFSDVPQNTIYKWKEGEGVSVFLRPSGFSGENPPGLELGTNGLTLDANGVLTMCDHGNRCVSQLLEKNFTKKLLANNYQGKRFNSPNDLVFKSNGDLYFTDPPYGLKGLNQDPNKQLEFNGVYRVTPSGEVTLLTRETTFPNGIAFSPDEKTLYVAQSDPAKAVWFAFEVLADGTLGKSRVLFDATPWVKQGKKGLPDGLAVDQAGNLFATGPGGVVVISPSGKHLGTIDTGEATANCKFGDDGSVLYITADMYLCRIKLSTKGVGFN